MKNSFIKILIPVSCTLLLCSCGNTATKIKEEKSKTAAESKEPIVQINLKDYIHTEVEGYDTVGTVKSYGLDTVKIAEDNKKAFKIPENTEDDAAMTAAVNCLNSYLDIKADKIDLLSNGDLISFNLNDNYKDIQNLFSVDINANGIEYTVSGLTPLKEMDPFESVKCEFLHLPEELGENLISSYLSDSYRANGIYCKMDKETVKVGETVTVEYYTDSDQYTIEQYFAMQGYKPTQLVKEYIAE